MGKIVGLTGWQGKIAGVGKDTAAAYLVDYHRTEFRSIAFADPIRAAMKVIFGWDDSMFTQAKKNLVDPEFGISPRKAMQTLGTEWGRELINSDLWLILAGKRAEGILAGDFNVLITDTRFENEAQWIRKNGGMIIHLDRNVEKVESHVSEQGIKFVDGIDIKIDNNETLGNLYYNLDIVAKVLRDEAAAKRKAQVEREIAAQLKQALAEEASE